MDSRATLSAAESESVRLTRRIAASPERVFQCWVNPALLRRWLAPIAEADARVGGRFRLEVSKAEGTHVVSGEYREFVPNQRLAMTWVYEGPMTPAGKIDALLTVEFRKDGSNTEISLHHEGLTNPVYLETIRHGAWTKALDDLEAVLAGHAPGETSTKAT
ncbi:MAG: SRPBCC family protein [Terriglobia bacterium]